MLKFCYKKNTGESIRRSDIAHIFNGMLRMTKNEQEINLIIIIAEALGLEVENK